MIDCTVGVQPLLLSFTSYFMNRLYPFHCHFALTFFRKIIDVNTRVNWLLLQFLKCVLKQLQMSENPEKDCTCNPCFPPYNTSASSRTIKLALSRSFASNSFPSLEETALQSVVNVSSFLRCPDNNFSLLCCASIVAKRKMGIPSLNWVKKSSVLVPN